MATGQIVRRTASNLLPAARVNSLEWVELERNDATARFVGLTGDLGRPFDPMGNGKRIASAHAYSGMGAALAWAAVCRDSQTVQAQSIEMFARRWQRLRGSAPAEPCHYVSLGPGDGRKDGVLLADMSLVNADVCYLPVETSDELLHMAIRGLIRRLGLPADRVMSLPWDFSMRESVAALRRLLDGLFGRTPILFSLLGNTIAHFDDDLAQLRLLATLLRPGDRLLLEVEVTAALSGRLAVRAVDEYVHSSKFGEFVASSLRHHVDLQLSWDDVEHVGTVEPDRALRVKTLYRADEDMTLTLPNNASMRFAFGDTVRLGLTRKYSPEGLSELVSDAGLSVVNDMCTGTGGPFGLALLMLEAG